MSLLQSQGSALTGAVDCPSSTSLVIESAALMTEGNGQSPFTVSRTLDPHADARAIVRLIQCSQCSLPLRSPLTLPCGNSICRLCLPELHTRQNISYPMIANRQEGFQCPFPECGHDHAVGDCGQDVTLTKALEKIAIEVARYRPITSDTPTLLDERLRWRNVVDSSVLIDQPRSRILSGGRLVATYTMAELGELRYDSELSYQTMSPIGDNYRHLDIAMLENLKEVTRNEMDCQVCYSLLLDPLTTTCGHTFCRKCVTRVLDHSTLCPICRRQLFMRRGVSTEPSNKQLSNLLLSLCPEHVAARLEAATQEEVNMEGDRNVPLFVVTLAYPSMLTFLHIFEPRYRLMMRRAIESGDRKFGMLMYNRRHEPQGDLGATQFVQYGTLLHIVSIQMLPDGRSLVETVGVSRFRVKNHGLLDGYVVANIEQVDDISVVDEEQAEAAEVGSRAPATDLIAQLNALPTKDLLQIGIDFITRMRARSEPWIRENVIALYGAPPEDAALFPYWFASILPISEDEKYKLLATTSVRERLKITATWVRKIEAQRWNLTSAWESDSDFDSDSGSSGEDGTNPDAAETETDTVPENTS